MVIGCAVVGAGPAGLSASAALTERGVEHVVLERGRVGETWRTQRWDSFGAVALSDLQDHRPQNFS
jgi:putative flavoprotein involved in K+ transport